MLDVAFRVPPAATISALVMFSTVPSLAYGKAFLGEAASPVDVQARTFRAAAEAVLGCRGDAEGQGAFGGEGAAAHLEQLQGALGPLWRTLPKNGYGRVEWRMLRYMSHRHFMKQSGLIVRGFEPARHKDGGVPNSSSAVASPLMDVLLQTDHAQTMGYTLHDAAAMVATIEQLIFNSEESLLLAAYSGCGKTPGTLLRMEELSEVIEAYLGLWTISNGNDVEGLLRVVRNRSRMERVLPTWGSIVEFGRGVLESFHWARLRQMRRGDGRTVMSGEFSFADAHRVVGQIARSFAPFWEHQCQGIKSSLQKFDRADTGRVSLSRFYRARQEGEWRFGESEAYLRDLGILDESSPVRGPQLMIPNYVQGISNCIVSNANYHVCCMSECEEVLNDLESTVGGPVATPEEISRSLEDMSSFGDEPLRIQPDLRRQLWSIAETHGGRVPLHGRLFAQWLHYVFPQECAFPHTAGSTQSRSLHEFGAEAYSSDHEAMRHASAAEVQESADLEDERWMSQWSEEEELLADYSVHFRSSWGSHLRALFPIGAALAGVLSLLGYGGYAGGILGVVTSALGKDNADELSCSLKAHLV